MVWWWREYPKLCCLCNSWETEACIAEKVEGVEVGEGVWGIE